MLHTHRQAVGLQGVEREEGVSISLVKQELGDGGNGEEGEQHRVGREVESKWLVEGAHPVFLHLCP